MMGTTPADQQTRPRSSTLDRPTLMRLAAIEYDRVTTTLRELSPSDWDCPTECPGWDVRAMAGHVLGMAEMAASVREGARQQLAAKRRGGVFIDALTALQVEARAGLTPQQVVERLQVVGPRAAAARRRTPAFVRNRRMPGKQVVGDRLEDWTLGFLLDTILTRDPWMHRIDISRATGRPLTLTADHDGVLVADVVHEWAGRHGTPCQLRLSGPAGGAWEFGTGSPSLELDAVDFCRALAGRGGSAHLFSTEVPF